MVSIQCIFSKMAFSEENHAGHDECSHDFLWLAYILLGDKNDFFSCHKDTVQETCNWWQCCNILQKVYGIHLQLTCFIVKFLTAHKFNATNEKKQQIFQSII